MGYSLTPGMVAAACTAAVLGYAIARRDLSIGWSFSIACLKAAIPLIFFLYFYDGRWYFLDDFTYEQEGRDMIAAGFNPFTALATSDGRTLLNVLSGGHHLLYGWWNLLAQWAFGQAYWAPIFLNVVLTFVIAYGMARMLEDLGFERQYVRGYVILFLVHVEVLAWSSFVNLKDILILALTVLTLRSIVALARLWKVRRILPRREILRRGRRHVLLFAAFTFAFYYVRFYVPFLLLSVVIVWSFLSLPGWWRVAALVAAPIVGFRMFEIYSGYREFVQPSGLLLRIVRFSLTPRPWATDPNYSFLILPAFVHWLFFVPAVAAGIAIWMRHSLARLPLGYVIISIGLFAAVPELYGPRHRIQVLPLIVWLQFQAIWWGLELLRRRVPAGRRVELRYVPQSS